MYPYCHQVMDDCYSKASGKAIIWTTKKHLNPLITTQEEILARFYHSITSHRTPMPTVVVHARSLSRTY
ncbi:hypothetical protein [Sharpea azabuensis]|uniref:hypothetical protein n=1 Tax=Sharpea azabuensis TaxID=322505 RepID=UPI003CFDC5D4